MEACTNAIVRPVKLLQKLPFSLSLSTPVSPNLDQAAPCPDRTLPQDTSRQSDSISNWTIAKGEEEG